MTTASNASDLEREIQMMETENYNTERWQRGLAWLRELRDLRAKHKTALEALRFSQEIQTSCEKTMGELRECVRRLAEGKPLPSLDVLKYEAMEDVDELRDRVAQLSAPSGLQSLAEKTIDEACDLLRPVSGVLGTGMDSLIASARSIRDRWQALRDKAIAVAKQRGSIRIVDIEGKTCGSGEFQELDGEHVLRVAKRYVEQLVAQHSQPWDAMSFTERCASLANQAGVGRYPSAAAIARLIREFYDMDGNAAGGLLHIVLDDDNTERHYVEWCRDRAVEAGDASARALAELLLVLTDTDREHVVVHRRDAQTRPAPAVLDRADAVRIADHQRCAGVHAVPDGYRVGTEAWVIDAIIEAYAQGSKRHVSDAEARLDAAVQRAAATADKQWDEAIAKKALEPGPGAKPPRATDQPTPKHDPTKPDVWAAVIAHASMVGMDRKLLDVMRARRQLGIERYGTPLQPWNGRDVKHDLREELLDATAYAAQAAMERRFDGWKFGPHQVRMDVSDAAIMNALADDVQFKEILAITHAAVTAL